MINKSYKRISLNKKYYRLIKKYLKIKDLIKRNIRNYKLKQPNKSLKNHKLQKKSIKGLRLKELKEISQSLIYLLRKTNKLSNNKSKNNNRKKNNLIKQRRKICKKLCRTIKDLLIM